MKLSTLTALFIIGTGFASNAQDYTVSGAGSSGANGTYTPSGTYNGKTYYAYNSGTEDYIIAWACDDECENWHLFQVYCPPTDCLDPLYVTDAAESSTPPSTGWQTSYSGSSPTPAVQVAGPAVSYSSATFFESEEDNGSTEGVVVITHNAFDGASFTGSNGEDFITSGKATVTNVPNGFTAKLTRTSSTALSFSLLGSANSHTNTDDISNLALELLDAAFSGGVAADISGYSKSDLSVEFFDVLTVASSGADHTTIAAAVAAAEDYDVIELAAETFTETAINVSKTLTFRGKGANQTFIQAHASPFTGTNRMFRLNGSALWVKFYDITFRNGNPSGAFEHGGAINATVPLEVYRCAFIDNQAQSSNEGGGGAIRSQSDLRLESCLFTGNKAIRTTSGSCSGGAVFLTNGQLVARNCTFSDNMVQDAGTNSNCGGLYSNSGSHPAEVANCTFTGNSAGNAGGGLIIANSGSVTNVIAYGNTASVGADFYRASSSVVINGSNCIFGSTGAYPSGAAINGTSSNISSSDPLLEALADNGGITETHALGTGSPAIDAGVNGIADTDQNGFYRNGTRDIGAHENNGLPAWKGSTSNDWNTASNWGSGSVPTSSDDVFIMSDAVRDPHVTTSTAACNGLTIGTGASLTIDPGKALTANGTTSNEGTILIKADATGIGSFIDNGTITGSGAFRMEQYLTGAGGVNPNGLFYYVGSPVVGATAINYNIACGNKLWSANEVSQSYSQITNGSAALNTTQGYVARMGATETIIFDGSSFNTGNVSASGLTRTGTSATNRGYNLVGNPYPSTVDWDNLGRTNLETTMWYRTHQGTTMLYDTYNATGMIGTNNNGNGAVDGSIPPTQAFWVRVDADGNTGQLDFENADRSHGTLAGIYKTESEEGNIRLTLSDGNIGDEQIILFNPAAQDGFDDFDSHKYWASNVPQLYSNVAEDTLTINGLYSPQTNPTVPLGMKLPTQGNYTLNASSITFTETPVHLEDTYLNVFQDLNSNPNYAFTSMEGNISDRFILHFSAVTGVEEAESAILIYSSAAQIYINRAEAGSATVTVLDLSGRTILTENINSQNATVRLNAPTGIYLVRVESRQQTTTKKLTVR